MKTITLTILSIIILVASINAVDIIAGNSYTFPTEQFEYFTLVGNQSNIEGLEVNWDDGNTTISLDPLFKSDSFTIILFNEKEVVTTINVGGGSSGGGTRTIYRDRIIPEIFEKEVIKEVPGDTITETNEVEVEKIINKAPIWMWILLILGGITLVIMGIILMKEW